MTTKDDDVTNTSANPSECSDGPELVDESQAVVPQVSNDVRRAIEALILVSDRPLPSHLLAQFTEVSVESVDEVCKELAAEYDESNRGFVLSRVAGGYRFQTHPDLAPYIERFALEGQSSRLSAAALETLSIIAYKQPLSRGQVAAIRGVNADAVIRTLAQRGYIAEQGEHEEGGLAALFGTTDLFLERIGLDSLSELPALGDFAPGSEIVEALEQSLSTDGLAVEPDLADPDVTSALPQESLERDGQVDASVDDRLDAVVIDLRDSVRSEAD
jgi:segregation and condensation protein B